MQRTIFPNWNVSCIFESLAYHWMRHAMLVLRLHLHDSRDEMDPNRQHRNQMLRNFFASVVRRTHVEVRRAVVNNYFCSLTDWDCYDVMMRNLRWWIVERNLDWQKIWTEWNERMSEPMSWRRLDTAKKKEYLVYVNDMLFGLQYSMQNVG